MKIQKFFLKKIRNFVVLQDLFMARETYCMNSFTYTFVHIWQWPPFIMLFEVHNMIFLYTYGLQQQTKRLLVT